VIKKERRLEAIIALPDLIVVDALKRFLRVHAARLATD
jgi:hypothetical protein